MVSVELVLVAVDPVHVDVVLAGPGLGPGEVSTGVPEYFPRVYFKLSSAIGDLFFSQQSSHLLALGRHL